MKLAHRLAGAVLGLVLAAFLASSVVGAVRGEAVTPLMLWLAAAALLVGIVFAMVRSMRFAAVPGLTVRGPLPVFLFVLFAGFIGGVGLEQTMLALRPTLAVTAEVTTCGVHKRTVKCTGRYTVDGERYQEHVPGKSVPAGGKLDIEVLRADPSVVVSKSWLDVLFFRGGGIALLGLSIWFGVRWFRLARTASVELRAHEPREVHSIGSNPSVN